MARLIILFAAIALASVALAEVEYPLTDIKIVKHIEDYTKENPHATVRLMTASRNARGQKRFTAGRRVNGDRLVAQGNNNYNYPGPQDVSVNLRYPQSGTGLNVTYVDILVNQSSENGNTYIVSGGVGQRYIQILVEAKYTTMFSYNAQFFAK